MKLLFRQRFFSWLDSYDIFDEYGNTAYQVEGRLSWGHCLDGERGCSGIFAPVPDFYSGSADWGNP